MSYGNQQALIADPVRQQENMIQVIPGQPHLRIDIPVPGELQNYFGWIVTGLINEIQGKMGNSAQRMHLFNLVAVNQYANAEFFNMVQQLTFWIDATCRTTNGMDPETAINRLTPQFVGLYALALVSVYPDLYQYLDPQSQNSVNSAVNGMTQMANLIAQVQQRLQGGAVQGTYRGGQMTGNHNTYGQNRANFTNAAISSGGGVGGGVNALFNDQRGPSHGNPSLEGGSSGRKSRYARLAEQKQTEQRERMENAGTISGGTGTWRRHTTNPNVGNQQIELLNPVQPAKPTHQLPEVVKSTQAPAPAAAPSQPPEPPKPLVWKSSTSQPYQILFDFTRFEMKNVKAGEDVIGVMKTLTPEQIESMNPEDHAMLRPPLPRYDVTKAVAEGEEEQVTETLFPPLPDFQVEFHEDDMLEMNSGVTSAITKLRFMIGRAGKPDRSIAKCFPAIMLDVVSVEEKDKAEKYRDIIDRLTSAVTFDEGVKILDEIADSEEDRLFFNRLDLLMAQEMTNIVSMNVYVHMRIDSFYDDIFELLDTMEKRIGPVLTQAFKNNQRLFFKQVFADIKADSLYENTQFLFDEYIGNAEENPDQWKGEFVLVPWQTTFTHLALPSYQLNISLAPGRTGALTEQSTPELYALATKILKHEGTASEYRRHYITTSDGLQFIMQRGYLKSEAILLRRMTGVS